MEVKSDPLHQHVHIVWLVKSPFSQQLSNRVFFPGNRTQKNPGDLQGIDMCIFHLYSQNNNIFGRHSTQKRKKKRTSLFILYPLHHNLCFFYLSSHYKLWTSRGKSIFINLCVSQDLAQQLSKVLKEGTE